MKAAKEASPGGAVWEGEEVDEFPVGVFCGDPVADVGHAVLGEEGDGVVAEAGEEAG